MKSTVLLIIMTSMLVMILPLHYLLFTSFYLAASVVCWDYIARNKNVANLVVAFVSSMVCIFYYGFGQEAILPYVGSLFYLGIALLALLSAAIKRPFTLKNPNATPSEHLFHVIMDVVIGLANLSAIALSFLLAPHFTYIFVPLALSMASVVFSHLLVRWIFRTFSLEEKLKGRASAEV